MRKYFTFIIALIYLNTFSQVGINTTTPHSSAMLDVESNEKGMLIPRMTVSERIAIVNPAEGLLVYQTDDIDGFYYFNGIQWIRLLDYQRDSIPVGAIFAFPFETIPSGYLICDGSAISRTTYANLFALIGVMYGSGDGSTTFNLPDYRGEFLRGVDSGSGKDPDAISRTDRGDGVFGDVVGTKQLDENIEHYHNNNIPSFNTTTNGSHIHYTQSFGANTSLGGMHNHYATFNGSTSSNGGHSHNVAYRNVEVEDPGVFESSVTIREVYPGSGSAMTTSTPNHSHSVSGTVTVNGNGNHNHTFSIPSLSVSNSGSHDHTVSIPSFDSESIGGLETRPRNVNVIWCIKY